jgi:hypothetical protein
MEILRIKEHGVLVLSKKPQIIGGCLQNDQQCLIHYLSGSSIFLGIVITYEFSHFLDL